jgi:hypothetical protein
MKIKITWFCTAALMCLLLSAPASAGVLYDNGAVSGSSGGFQINSIYIVANSFTLSSNSTLTGVNFGLWATPTDTPFSVDWTIWSAAGPGGGGTALNGPTTAALTNTFLFVNANNFSVYSSSFSLPSIALGASTYWLQIMNASTARGDTSFAFFWDQNNGRSQAWGNTFASPIPSESFQIIGTTDGGNSVPEPSSMALLGPVLLLAGLFRRKLSR